jgi:hypothetical protein
MRNDLPCGAIYLDVAFRPRIFYLYDVRFFGSRCHFWEIMPLDCDNFTPEFDVIVVPLAYNFRPHQAALYEGK